MCVDLLSQYLRENLLIVLEEAFCSIAKVKYTWKIQQSCELTGLSDA